MKPDSGAPPELKDELNRKVMDTMSWLITRVGNGYISEQQFSTAVDALFMAVSGLVDREFFDLVTAASKEVEGLAVQTNRRVFRSKKEVVSVSWSVGQDVLTVTRLDMATGEENTKRTFFSAPKTVKDGMDKLCAHLIKNGYKEI